MVERVYIGGIDPDKLPRSLVVNRIKSLRGIEVKDVDIPRENSDYFFVNLTLAKELERVADEDGSSSSELSEPKPEKTQTTATEILIQKYNNTKWRGCKIRVEAAQISFMQRLELERAEISAQQSATEKICTRVMPLEESIQQTVAAGAVERKGIPRKLKIRKKFGDAPIRVDTKPVQIHAQVGTGEREFYKDIKVMI